MLSRVFVASGGVSYGWNTLPRVARTLVAWKKWGRDRSVVQPGQRCYRQQRGTRAFTTSAPPPPPPRPTKSSMSAGPGGVVQRKNIGFFGRMNVGKSTLMNAITQQETSIVDSKPGTTADTKIALMEFHALGPVKLFDTAGLDEEGTLGDKKRRKTMQAIKEADVALLVVDPLQCGDGPAPLDVEREVIDVATKRKKAILVVYNIFNDKKRAFEARGGSLSTLCEDIHHTLTGRKMKETQGFDTGSNELPVAHYVVDLGGKKSEPNAVALIEDLFRTIEGQTVPILPHLSRNSTVFLNIPMDEETPGGRLLRPQAMVQEHLLRDYVSTFCYRMDLAAARSSDTQRREAEKRRFQSNLLQLGRLPLLITDSQAMDIVHPWTLDEEGKPLCEITTFSVVMVNHQTNGRLMNFVDGVRKFQNLKKGDRVLIAEACNHNRLAICEDIGTRQIPKKIAQSVGEGAVTFEWEFGREFPADRLHEFSLVIHCGGCMIDRQKMVSRLDDILEAGTHVTNYGVLLSYMQSPQAMERVLRPWSTDILSRHD